MNHIVCTAANLLPDSGRIVPQPVRRERASSDKRDEARMRGAHGLLGTPTEKGQLRSHTCVPQSKRKTVAPMNGLFTLYHTIGSATVKHK
jgi:hypothetical protein